MSMADELHYLFRHNSPGTVVALGMELIREQFKKMNNTHQFHNPDNLEPEQYSSHLGWRLLTKDELDAPPKDSEFLAIPDDCWTPRDTHGKCDGRITYRTRTPLPQYSLLAAWIKMSDRKPTEADLPLAMASWRKDGSGFWSQTLCWENLPPTGNWDYWCAMMKLPALPAKEPARDELDREAWKHILDNEEGDVDMISFRRGFFAALNYERSALRLLLDKYTANSITIQQLVAEIKGRVEP